MIAVLSITEHDYYAMPLPMAVYSWLKAGATEVIVFAPSEGKHDKIDLALKYCPNTTVYWFVCEEKRIPTYSQVVRNFGAMADLYLPYDMMMWTGDSDMCVFTDYFKDITSGINVVGYDLTPPDQYPMCFVGMSVMDWRNKVCLTITTKESEPKEGRWLSPQEATSKLIDPIEGINIRGEQWNYDQWFLKKRLDETNSQVTLRKRSNGLNQFATQRADRDSWQNFNPYDIIDAHLPRPLTIDDNFNKVYDLFRIKYPDDDLTWMKEYQQKYKALL